MNNTATKKNVPGNVFLNARLRNLVKKSEKRNIFDKDRNLSESEQSDLLQLLNTGTSKYDDINARKLSLKQNHRSEKKRPKNLEIKSNQIKFITDKLKENKKIKKDLKNGLSQLMRSFVVTKKLCICKSIFDLKIT